MRHERRPRGGEDGAPTASTPGGEVSHESTPDDLWQDVADVIGGAFVVVVTVPGGLARRRVYLTVKSAERAAERAAGRGQVAHVALCRLSPVSLVVGEPGRVVA